MDDPQAGTGPAPGRPLGGRRALVTGSSDGIGAALAEALAAEGVVVGVTGRRAEKVDRVVARCRRHTEGSTGWAFDLLDHDGIEDFARRVQDDLGPVDLLVNNAGIPKRRRIDRLSAHEVREVTDLNYVSAVLLTLALLPPMLERGRGHILNVASVAGRLGSPGEAAYAASKAALAVWSEASAAELASRGIVVQVVYPGPVATDIVNAPGEDPPLAARSGIERLSVEDAVGQILDHLRSPNFEAWIPAWFRDIYVAKVADPDRSIRMAGEWVASNLL